MSGWQIKKLLKQLAKILNICDIVFCGNLMVNLVIILEIKGLMDLFYALILFVKLMFTCEI